MTEPLTTPIPEDEISLLDLLLALAKRWRMIATITVLAAVVSSVVALLLPNRYQATAKVIALQRQTLQLVNADSPETKATVGTQRAPLQIANMPVLQDILEGSEVRQAVTQQVGAPASYQVKVAKSGAISVIAESTDPKHAAAIANAAVAQLGHAAYALNLVSSPVITTERDLEKLDRTVTAAIKLLDPAAVPTQKAKPKRALIVVLATVTGCFVAVFLAFMLEAFKNLQPDDRQRWEEIKRAFRGQ